MRKRQHRSRPTDDPKILERQRRRQRRAAAQSKKTPAREYWGSLEIIAQGIKDPPDEIIRELARSIRRYGLVMPIIFWPSRNIFLTGRQRIAAVKHLLSEDPAFVVPHASYGGVVPVRQQEFASDADARPYSLADHRLTEQPAWDDAIVNNVLAEFAALDEKHGITSWLTNRCCAPEQPLREIWSSAEDFAHLAWWAEQGHRFRPSPYSADEKARAERELKTVIDEMRGRIEYGAWPTAEEYRELRGGPHCLDGETDKL